jgi:glycosyltransferase involved in cell wall biosynthesis
MVTILGRKARAMSHTSKEDGCRGLLKYSICITNYNAKDTLSQCLESVFSQIASDFEVVVCDNFSTEGSREILEEYAKKGKIKLIIEHSSRGKGRQIAFENSIGNYIISGIDTDDVIKPVLRDVLRLYHEKHEGYMLSFGTIHIIPRHLVIAVGGWRDLQWGEDVDFTKRIAFIGKSHYFPDASRIVEKKGSLKMGFLHRIRERYVYYQCRYRIGLSIFDDLRKDSWHKRPVEFFIVLFALAMAKLRRLKKFEYSSDQQTNCSAKT